MKGHAMTARNTNRPRPNLTCTTTRDGVVSVDGEAVGRVYRHGAGRWAYTLGTQDPSRVFRSRSEAMQALLVELEEAYRPADAPRPEDVRVGRDGTATLNGEVLGTVRKLAGVAGYYSDAWDYTTADGTRSHTTFSTRKRAVADLLWVVGH